MHPADQNEPQPVDEELKRLLDGPGPDEDATAMQAGIRYLAPMTPTQRLARHAEARPVVERLNAFAARHGIRSLGWAITGPADVDAPEVPGVRP